jgi:hypothetical protein
VDFVSAAASGRATWRVRLERWRYANDLAGLGVRHLGCSLRSPLGGNVMNRLCLGTAAALLVAGQLVFASDAYAHDKTVVVQPPAPNASPRVAVTQPQPVETRPVGAETVRAQYAGPNTMLIGSGLLVFGVAYGTSAIVAGTSDHPGDRHLYVPVVGPWMNLADRGSCGGRLDRSCDNETTNKVLLVADGVFQGIGVLSIIGGFLSPEHREVVTTTAKKGASKPTFHVSPARIGYSGYGLAAFGTF